MKLFKNGVGRPSNETLKNRKIFIISMLALIIAFVAIIISSITLLLGNNNLNKLKGAATKTFTVKYSANGGKGSMSEQAIIYGVKTNLNANKFTKSGYKFKGWHAKRIVNNKTLYRGCKTSGTCSNEDAKWLSIASIKSYFVYKDKEEVSQTAPIGQTVTMIAQWEKTSSTTSSSSNTFSKLISGFLKLAIKIFDKDNWNIENFTTTTRADENKKTGSIAIGSDRTTLDVGMIYSFSITGTSKNAKITAKSSNTNILTVEIINNDTLKIYTSLGGTAEVTLQSETGAQFKRKYTVNGKSISMSKYSDVWDVIGSAGTATVKLSNKSDTFTVKSSNEKVMSVKKLNDTQYKIKALAIGTAKITATSKNTGDSISYTYKVFPKTTWVYNSSNKIVVKKGTKVTSSNPKVISVYKISDTVYNLFGKSAGTSTIEATLSDGNAFSVTYNVSKYSYPDKAKLTLNGIKSNNTYNGIEVFVEKGCSDDYVNKYLADIKELPSYIAKTVNVIYIVTADTYSKNKSDGSAYAYLQQRYVVVKCNRYLGAAVAHESAHQMDYFYNLYTGKGKISEQAGWKNIYDKYKNTSTLTKHSREYSYEFFAESYAHYFHNNIAKTNKLSNSYLNGLSLPNDVKTNVIDTINEVKNINW